jgi:TIGR03009 family protein
MRVFSYTVVALAALAGPVFAQGPMQPITPQEQAALDQVLRGWEKSMTDLRSFITKVDRESLDKALQAKDQYKGYAIFLKANVKDDQSRARLELAKVTNPPPDKNKADKGKEKSDKSKEAPSVFEKYICTGTYLYEYAAAQKVVRVHDMPQNKKGGQQESFLSFLFGMGADEAKARYEMRPVFPKVPDQYYHYIRIKPKMEADKSDFAEARLSLYKANNLPAQIWYLQPNGNEITWSFTELQVDKDIPLSWFQPDIPKDWRVERVPQKQAPAVPPTVRGSK